MFDTTLVGGHCLECDYICILGMALLSSNVIAELDKRKQLNETKAALSSSSSSLARRPLHQSQSKATAAELKQVTIISLIVHNVI